jgi:hypothetical protein
MTWSAIPTIVGSCVEKTNVVFCSALIFFMSSMIALPVFESRFGGERAGDRDPLPLPSRELVRPVPLPGGEPHLLDEVIDPLPLFTLRHLLAAEQEGKLDVFPHVEHGNEVERLEYEPDEFVPERRHRPVLAEIDGTPVELDRTVGRFVDEPDEVENGRLPRSRRTGDRYEFTLLDREIDPVHGENVHLAERVFLSDVDELCD